MIKTQCIWIESLEDRRFFSFATIIGDVLVVDGDPGEDDTIVISLSAANIVVNHDDVSNQRFNISQFSSVTFRGDTGDDTLIVEGSIGVPTEILGQGGDDTIDGGRDLARLDGGTGDDHITGTGILIGGTGNDTLLGGRKRDFLYGGSGADSIRGGRASDIIFGGSEDDTCKGEAGNDVIFGEDGRDKLRGGEGNDKLFGAIGKDTLFGDEGDDTLYGGENLDVLDAGSGRNKVRVGVFVDLNDLINHYEELADDYLDV